MKKYFVRLLPVTGDVKSAKHVIYKHEAYGHFPMLNNKDPEVYTFIMANKATRGYHEKWEDLKRAELFLCTPEVQIGDTDFYADPQALELYAKGLRHELVSIDEYDGGYKSANIKYLVNHTRPESVGHVREWPYECLWKMVAQTSLEALWLENEMQFDEQDVRFKLINQGYKIDPAQLKYVPEAERSKWSLLAEFVCPSCKNFK